MVSDQEIASCVESLLRQAGPAAASTATVAGVVRQLEVKLGLDLSQKTGFVRDQIDLLVGPHRPPPPAPAAAGPSGKDHFALSHHHHQQIQFQAQQPPSQHHHQATVHQLSFSPAASSPFTHLPHHHELSFRYPTSVPAATAPEAVALEQQHLRQLQFQFQQHQQPQQQQAPQVSAPIAVRSVATPAPKESAPKRRGGPGGLSKVCGVSPELQAIVGEPTMARTQIVKQLWAYIRRNNLQDPNNKRKIICNDELRRVFETDCTDMFKMNKLLAKHIIPLEGNKDSGSDAKKLKTAVREVVSSTETDPDRNTVVISDALASFLGTKENEMLQSEALRRVWDYIKTNQLEDSVNGMGILCDSKLQELLGCENISALGVSQMLSRHMFKKS